MRRLTTTLLVLFIIVSTCTGAWATSIEDVKSAIAQSGAQWLAAENDVADLHFTHGWYNPKAQWPFLTGTEIYYEPSDGKNLPDNLDWRDYKGQNWVTPVRDQSSCGSCWAFGSVGAIESNMAYYDGTPDPQLDLAEQQLLSCAFNLGCDGGGFTNFAFEYTKNTGLVDEQCFPYVAEKVNCNQKCFDWKLRLKKINSWQIVSILPNTQKIMDALQNGPVATSLMVYDDFFYYSGGVYTHVAGQMAGMHVVTIVGYNAAEQYWICKNSWGESWGEDGFFRIKFGAALIGLFTVLPVYYPPPANFDFSKPLCE